MEGTVSACPQDKSLHTVLSFDYHDEVLLRSNWGMEGNHKVPILPAHKLSLSCILYLTLYQPMTANAVMTFVNCP